MKLIVRASLVLEDGSKTPRHIPALDEDEATLAVDAAQRLLADAGLAPERITRLEVTSTTGRGWGPTVQAALGLRGAQLVDLDLVPPAPAADKDALVLRIRSNAPRALAPTKNGQAEAELLGPGLQGATLAAPLTAPRRVNVAAWEKIRRWNEEAPRSVPMGAYVPRATWDASLEARARMLASTCEKCEACHHPPLERCARCGGPTRVAPLAGPGTIYTFTSIAKGGGPTEFDPMQDVDGEYQVAIVEFTGGVRLAGILASAGPEEPAIGQAVEPVFRRIYAQEGAWRYGVKFRSPPKAAAP